MDLMSLTHLCHVHSLLPILTVHICIYIHVAIIPAFLAPICFTHYMRSKEYIDSCSPCFTGVAVPLQYKDCTALMYACATPDDTKAQDRMRVVELLLERNPTLSKRNKVSDATVNLLLACINMS